MLARINMNTEVLVDLLEHHFIQAEQAQEIYKIRLRRTIDRLKEGFYLQREEDLIIDLESLGFGDLGCQIRREMFI